MWDMHVSGILSSLGTVALDGAFLIGTACPQAVPQYSERLNLCSFPRKGLTPARAETMQGFGSRKPGPRTLG